MPKPGCRLRMLQSQAQVSFFCYVWDDGLDFAALCAIRVTLCFRLLSVELSASCMPNVALPTISRSAQQQTLGWATCTIKALIHIT
jgi:hypothetical protein